jgi:alanyl-tRNA synthetase
MIADGVRPSNTERGYVLRRLLRRAALHTMKLSLGDKDKEDSMLVRSSELTLEKYAEAYTELEGEAMFKEMTETIWKEEQQFVLTLERGMKEFERVAANGRVEASEAYVLFTTHGFPFEMTMELATERGIDVDHEGFKREMKKHQELSRAGSEQKFKGGLADTSEKTTRLHTAHHLLLKALQIVLGPHVKQRGSNITQERLRIDFSHGEKMTKEQLVEVERIVNEKIQEGTPVIRTEMPKDEAEKLGAEHEFGVKYPDRVSVYSVGPLDSAFSIEFCGGPHVSNTKEIADGFSPSTPLRAKFSILKEEAVAAGIRRIKAVLQ